MTKSSKKEKEVEPYMICDEGGTHKFKFGKEVTCCDRFLCVCCFPCYALCSCILSEGAALANPLFEQLCCSKSRQDEDEKGRATCTKCGLTEREAIDLSEARSAEASSGNRQTGYFSNAMSMPSAQTSNQQQPQQQEQRRQSQMLLNSLPPSPLPPPTPNRQQTEER